MTHDYSFQEDVVQRLVRIETLGENATESHLDHEARIRGLEKRMWTVGGAAAVVGAVLTKLSMSLHLPFPWST